MKIIKGRNLLFILPLLFIAVFFYIPVLAAFTEGTAGKADSGFGWSIAAVLSSAYYRRIILFTLFQALVSTLAALTAGIPGAYILGRYSFPGKSFVKSMTSIPFVLPSILVVLGFVLFFGNNGHLNRLLMGLFDLDKPPLKILYSFKAIIMAHAFYNFPIVMRLLSSAWESLPRSQFEGARSLGAGRFFLFRTITIPRIMPSLLSSASLVFLFCFMSFAIILVLGGGPEFSTIEVEVYRLARFSLNFPMAASLGLTGTLLSMGLLSVNLALQRKSSAAPLGAEQRILPNPLFKRERGHLLRDTVLVLYLAAALIVLIGPLISVLSNSLQAARPGRSTETAWSLKWYLSLFIPGSRGYSGPAVINSLIFGLMTVGIALPLGTFLSLLSYRGLKKLRLPELIYMLPMGVSPVILGLGYIKILPLLPPSARGSWLVIAGAHSMVAYPFVIRAVTASLSSIPESLRQAAFSLGAGKTKVLFSIDIPLIRSGLLSGGAFAFALSLGEINATLLIADRNQITIPIAMYRLIGSYNFFGACALGTVLMVLCGAAFFIIDKFQENTL